MKEFYIDCDGIRLHAKLDRPKGKDKSPLCILVHGFTGHMEEEHIIAAQRAMNDAGVAVLRAEMYGHGGSDGKFREHTLYKWVTNALALISYAKSLDFVSKMYFCGHSQGGLLTMLIGGMCADELKAIIPLSPAWMIPEDARNGQLLGSAFDPVHIPDVLKIWDTELNGDYIRVAQTIHVENEIARYKEPVVIIHGDEDGTAPFIYSEKAQELYKNARLIPVRGTGHCFEGRINEFAEAVHRAIAYIDGNEGA